MYRLLKGVSLAVVAPLAVAIVVLLLGAALVRSSPDPSNPSMPFGCYDAPLISAFESRVIGDAVLCIRAVGARIGLTGHGLQPRGPYTVWLRIEDATSPCFSDSCAGEDRLPSGRVVLFGRLGSSAASPDGTVHFMSPVRQLPLTNGSTATLFLVGRDAVGGVADRSRLSPYLFGEVDGASSGSVLGTASFMLP